MVNNDHIKLYQKYQPCGCVSAGNIAKFPFHGHPGCSSFSLAKRDILAAANGKDHGRISSENASLQYGYHWGKKTIQKYGRERNLSIGRKN